MSRVETIGDATLYLGDCRTILPTLGPVDAVVTSPPYNQMESLTGGNASGIWGDRAGGLGFVENWKAKGYTDDLPEEKYQAWQASLFAEIAEICAPTASLFYNHQLRWRDGTCLHPIDWFKPAGWNLRAEIIWDRAGGMMFNARMFCRFDERILWMVRGDRWKWNQDHVGLGTIWRIPRAQNKEHPVAFPVDLPIRCIGATTDPGDLVFDPFMGSATTGVAAITLGRRFVGTEIDPTYFDIACRRIEAAYRQPDLFVEQPKPKPVQLSLMDAAE